LLDLETCESGKRHETPPGELLTHAYLRQILLDGAQRLREASQKERYKMRRGEDASEQMAGYLHLSHHKYTTTSTTHGCSREKKKERKGKHRHLNTKSKYLRKDIGP